jgi:hypothetical protein
MSGCPSPDGSGYPFVAVFAAKDINVQQVPGSLKKRQKKRTNFKSLSLILFE